MKFLTRSHVLLFLMLLFAVSCKHKEKQITAANKGKKTHKPAAKASVAKHTHEAAPGAANENPLYQKFGMSAKQIRDSKLYSFINDWYGVPYKYGGCLKTGVDCSCFTSILCEKVYNMKIPRSAGDMYNECEKIGLEDAREGDLCFFKINSNSISHVGVYLKSRLFVHSSTSRGVIINSVDEAYYKKYFFCAGRIKNPS
jgi:cell wall-associated NlpC family hydrolase